MRRQQLGRMIAACSALALLLAPVVVHAQQSQSTSYQVNEVYFGPGGNLNASSTNYGADQTAGDTANGRANSTNYQAVTGGQTNRNESLEFVVTNGSADLGILNIGSAKTAVTTFSVKSYLASGYVVTAASDPPKNAGSNVHTFVNLTTPTASSPGTEQFGINLAANTSPSIPGSAAPTQSPDSTFGYGAAATGYNTANLFKYVKGNVVASSAKSSGTTNYTVSYLFNVNTSTPAGQYTYNQVLVATSTF